jgi:hypothetical protein
LTYASFFLTFFLKIVEKIFGRFGKMYYFCGVQEQTSVNGVYDFFLKLFSEKLAYMKTILYLCTIKGSQTIKQYNYGAEND